MKSGIVKKLVTIVLVCGLLCGSYANVCALQTSVWQEKASLVSHIGSNLYSSAKKVMDITIIKQMDFLP